mmetsp:Transcript_22712/g.25859  ORF Transcript_22712/g.25859 Transcript_22712/m.25859 type:complete len:296 (+) Transcript_22712:39-926(+)
MVNHITIHRSAAENLSDSDVEKNFHTVEREHAVVSNLDQSAGISNYAKFKRHFNRTNYEEDIPISFPQRLMKILSTKDYSDIIGWLPHGQGFIIYQKKRFAMEILSKHFKRSKFTSFTRKLNRWKFTRIARGPETGAYYHAFFQRDKPRLSMQMSCQTPFDPQVTTSSEVLPITTGHSEATEQSCSDLLQSHVPSSLPTIVSSVEIVQTQPSDLLDHGINLTSFSDTEVEGDTSHKLGQLEPQYNFLLVQKLQEFQLQQHYQQLQQQKFKQQLQQELQKQQLAAISLMAMFQLGV